MIWDYFDVIRCINLKQRQDRYKSSKTIFSKHKIPVKYHHVDKHPNGGLHGCFESHIQIITDAYNSGARNIIIFEDDISDTKFLTRRNIKKIIRFLKTNKWDIFFLGPHPDIRRFNIEQTKFPSIYKIHSICGHAYILNRRYMKLMANMRYTETPLDYIYKFNSKSYGHIPSLFIQGSSKSDISGAFFNRLPILKIGSIKFVEFYSIYVNIKLPYFLVILILLLFFSCRHITNNYVSIFLTLVLLSILSLFVFCK